MHPYTKHLLEDIAKAHRPKDFFRKKKVNSVNQLEARLKESETFLNYEGGSPFWAYCGLDLDDFPPGEKFDIEDLHELTRALGKMLESWNILIVLPDNLPSEMGYRITLDLFHRSMPILQFGFYVMDFCTGDPVGCEFGSYCSCLKSWKENEGKIC